MSGYICDWDDTGHPARLVVSDMSTGAQISWCEDHFPPGILPIVAAELGVDPMEFYKTVERFVNRQAKAAEKPETADCPHCGTTIHGVAADIDSGLRKHMEHCEAAQAAADAEEAAAGADVS